MDLITDQEIGEEFCALHCIESEQELRDRQDELEEYVTQVRKNLVSE